MGSVPSGEEPDVVGQQAMTFCVDINTVEQPEDAFHGGVAGQGPRDHIEILAAISEDARDFFEHGAGHMVLDGFAGKQAEIAFIERTPAAPTV
jgi:hypothetical protein